MVERFTKDAWPRQGSADAGTRYDGPWRTRGADAGLSRAETDALAGPGIDVLDVVARVEEAHGVGAMSGDRRGLLALTLDPGGPAEVLADQGVTHESLARVLGEGTGEAACA